MKTGINGRRISQAAKRLAACCLLWTCATLSSSAQAVFASWLHTPQDGGATLGMGKFYFQVEQDTVDFVAIVTPFGSFTADLYPLLSTPAGSLEFSLGEGVFTAFGGSYTYLDRNPFLPFELPFLFDDEGHPYLIDTCNIRYGNLYTGHFALPDGFLDELLAGRGTVQFNDDILGSITVAAVPEPTTFALGLIAVGALFFVRSGPLRCVRRSATEETQ